MKKLLVVIFTIASLIVNGQESYINFTESFKDSVRVEFSKLLNNKRLASGIFKKIVNDSLYNVGCTQHSEYQAKIEKLTHDAPYIKKASIAPSGENCMTLWYNDINTITPYIVAKELIDGWVTSPAGHNYNLIINNVTVFGLGFGQVENSNFIFATYQVGNL